MLKDEILQNNHNWLWAYELSQSLPDFRLAVRSGEGKEKLQIDGAKKMTRLNKS